MYVPTALESYYQWVNRFGKDFLPPEYEKMRYDMNRWSRYYPNNTTKENVVFVKDYESKHRV